MSERRADICSECGTELEDESPGEERKPCPKCGSMARTARVNFHGEVTVSATFEAKVSRAWDSNSLTLAGVLYGILVTVVGVIVAPHGTLATLIYGAVAVLVLAVGLLFLAQPVIAAMRWLIGREKR